MREVPVEIASRLRDKDPLARIFWDQEIHKWILVWDGVRICALFHSDGADMIELCWDEISGLLDKFDNFKDGPERFAAICKVAANARRKAEQRAETLKEESMREAESVARTLQRGCPLQVYVKDNKIGRQKDVEG
jgi:hypothetical protein